MSSKWRTAGIVGGLIILAAAIGAGLFLFTGFQEGIWFTVAGIPIVVVAGIALYVRGVISRGGTSEKQYVQKRGRAVAESFQDALRLLRDLEQTYSKWSPSVDAQIQSIGEDFRRQGVEFDLDAGSFRLTGKVGNADIQEFERLESEIESVRQSYENEFTDFVEVEAEVMRQGCNRLTEADLVADNVGISLPSDGTVAEYRDALEQARSETEEILTEASDRVREMSRGETRPEDVEAVEAALEDAASAQETNDYRGAVESILEARDQLREQLSGSFEANHDQLVTLIDTVRASDVDKHVDAEYSEEVEAVGEALDSLETGLDLAELSRHRSTVRRTCIDMIAAMESDLDAALSKLRAADLPPGYYSEPDIADATFIDELGNIDDLDQFTERWETVADRLVTALNTASTKAAVLDAYEDVAETIETELHASGTVTEEDLPVRHGDQFLGLYYRRNDGVEFDPETGTLRRGSVTKYEVIVYITDPRGGEERTPTVTLTGGAFSESATSTTHIAATLTFEDVPKGTYSVTADPGVDSFATIERPIEVNSDHELDLTFEERSLREQVCTDSDIDMAAHLDEVGSDLKDRFKSEGYVSSEMDLPVRAAHAPCLVATWAEANAFDAARDGDAVVAFDRERIQGELQNVIKYNLDEGETLAFADLRTRFLSAPVPDTVIQDVIAEIHTDRDVRTAESSITIG